MNNEILGAIFVKSIFVAENCKTSRMAQWFVAQFEASILKFNSTPRRVNLRVMLETHLCFYRSQWILSYMQILSTAINEWCNYQW